MLINKLFVNKSKGYLLNVKKMLGLLFIQVLKNGEF